MQAIFLYIKKIIIKVYDLHFYLVFLSYAGVTNSPMTSCNWWRSVLTWTHHHPSTNHDSPHRQVMAPALIYFLRWNRTSWLRSA